MLSRKTALKIGEICESLFSYYTEGRYRSRKFVIDRGGLYDFLFENNYQVWFCNSVKSISQEPRSIKEHITLLHTGETLPSIAQSWSIETRQETGQDYLKKLAEDILSHFYSQDKSNNRFASDGIKDKIRELERSIELDGYKFKNNTLLYPEADVLDVETEQSYLKELIGEVKLGDVDTILHHLDLSETHYIDGKWDDSISNSRKYLESVLREVVNKHHSINNSGQPLGREIYDRAGSCINYLKSKGLLEEKEDLAIAQLYILLSDQGGHPYMAESDQARLLRNLSLIISQFILIRFKGYIDNKA